jgi:hypothetical protein
MKKTTLRLLFACSAPLLLSSCALVIESLATEQNIANLPEPMGSEMLQLKNDQAASLAAVAVPYAQGSKLMLKAYSTIADAVGMKKQAAALMAESHALHAGSSIGEARVAMSRSAENIQEVRNQISSAKGVPAISKSKFVEGVQLKNQAYLVYMNLILDAAMKANKATKAAKEAGPLEKAILTTQMDPLFFIVKELPELPKFLSQERAFNGICKDYAKEQGISLPPSPFK